MAKNTRDKIANFFQNPFNDPVVKTNTMLTTAFDGLMGDYDAAKAIINGGDVGIIPRKERMKGPDNDVIESLSKMKISGFCNFNAKMGEFMERLMRINLNEHNITVEETGLDAHAYGDSDSLNYDITKSYSYTKGNNYIEDFVKPIKKDEINGIDATQSVASDGAYMKTTNMYPDDITGAGSGDFSSYEKWAVKNKNSILFKTKQLFRQKKINTIISRFGTNADGRSNDILYKGSNRTAYGESHGRNLLTKDAENGGGGYNINGYNNPYCRVWTHHYKYDRLNKTIRPLSGNGTLSDFHIWGNGFNSQHINEWAYDVETRKSLSIMQGNAIYANGSAEVPYEGYAAYKDKNGAISYSTEMDVADYRNNKTHDYGWKGDPHMGWNYSVLDTSKGGDGLLRIAPKFNTDAESNIHPKDCMFSIENLAWKGYDPYSFENALSWEQRGPLGGRIMWFPPYGIEFNESTNVNWSRNTFIGRGEDVYTYVNTQRTGNLSFLMVVDHPSIIDYATWNTTAPQPSETDMLRFFAGCDDGEGGDSIVSYVQPTPLTDEGVSVDSPKTITGLSESTEIPVEQPKGNLDNKGKDIEKTNITVKVMAFFPNNYSGTYDNWAYTFGYLLMGLNTWTGFNQIKEGNNFPYIGFSYFKEDFINGWDWKDGKRIDTNRILKVDFKDVFFNGKFELFENHEEVKDESGNWVTRLQKEGEHEGKPMYYLDGREQYGYECNIKDGGVTDSDITGICKGSAGDMLPCNGVIYAYRTTFDKAYNRFVKDERKHKGVIWQYRVDGEYKQNSDTKNTFAQRIPDPNGKNIQPNENYKDKTNYKLNLNASSWSEKEEKQEDVILCSLNDFVAATDKTLFSGNSETSSDDEQVTLTNNNNYLYERSENKEQIKKIWNLFNNGKLLTVDCVGYSNSHGTATAGSKSNNPNLATMRATRLGELIEARFGIKANISFESAKAVTGQDHNSKEAKMWRSAVATLKFQVSGKDAVHETLVQSDEQNKTKSQIPSDEIQNQMVLGETQQNNTRLNLTRGTGEKRDTCSKFKWGLNRWLNRNEVDSYMFGSYYKNKLNDIESKLTNLPVKIGSTGYYMFSNVVTSEVRFRQKGTLDNGCKILVFDARAKGELSTAGACYEVNIRIDSTEVGKKYKDYVNIRLKPGQNYGKYIETFTAKSGANSLKVQEGKKALSSEANKLFGNLYNHVKRYAPSKYKNLTEISNQPLENAWLLENTSKKSETTTKTDTKVEKNKNSNSGSGNGSGGNNTPPAAGNGDTEAPNTQNPNATPVSNNINEEENKKLEQMRKNEVREAQMAAERLRKWKSIQDNNRYLQENNKIVEETVLTRITPDYMLRSDREGNGDKNILRYDQEYYFFKSLEKKDKIVYDKLMDKIKYFDPAFHSMTPEGFNARLTFLNQCTRQGNTISISDRNTTESGKLDRSVKTANNMAFGRPPYCVLRLGDFYNQMIVINSINIDYSVSDGIQWDMNSEGIGMQPLLARVNISFNFIGGSDMAGPVRRLQNAMTFNYYANARYYDNRADRMAYPANNSSLQMGAIEYNVDKDNSIAYVTAMQK